MKAWQQEYIDTVRRIRDEGEGLSRQEARALKGRCDRYDVDVPGGGERSLLKAQDHVVAKVSGRLIIHVFDKDSKGALVELSRPAALIAHLDSGLQNRLAELFADVPAAVESLGYGTDRDPQPVCDVFDCRS